MYAQDSIDLLTKSGINFQKHEDYGIDVHHFGELLISSGFVLLDDVKWISFHRYGLSTCQCSRDCPYLFGTGSVHICASRDHFC